MSSFFNLRTGPGILIPGLLLILLGGCACPETAGFPAEPLPVDGKEKILPASGALTDENNRLLNAAPVHLNFPYVQSACLTEEIQFGRPAGTLLLRFSRPQQLLSTLHGWRNGIQAAGNHYNHPDSWATAHALGLEGMSENCLRMLGIGADRGVLLFTGADVSKYAYVELEDSKDGEELTLGAFATAGVKSNAVRAGHDPGAFWEPGTINLIILSSRRLTPAAMCQLIIVATEAKTAALEDLDIRSSFSGKPATGTGTDNLIVIGGEGPAASMAGPHTRLGELAGRAVYQAVLEAVGRQNELFAGRDMLARLAERQVDVCKLVLSSARIQNAPLRQQLAVELVNVLREPYYKEFMGAALACSDAASRGLSGDSDRAFSDWCLHTASRLAGFPLSKTEDLLEAPDMEPALRMALNALVYGLKQRLNKTSSPRP
ncbi:MAG: adenosylcobinamide amidohydrolase [Desulfovibrionaceae bacterium]|nr:adenosylcobinamide amidohydrolase [Desulfovibrionaceae bacterium]